MSDVVDDLLLRVELPAPVPPRIAVEAVRDTMLAAGGGEDPVERITEVVASLVREARDREPFAGGSDRITVDLTRHGDRFSVRVTDRRMPAIGSAAASREKSFQLAEQGGIADIRHSSNADGNVAECSIHVAEDEAWLAAETQLDESAPRVSDEEAAALALRPGTPEDARGIVRLTFRCYGYTYVDRTLYAPDAIAELIRSGTMASQVAVAPDGSIVAHQAITSDPNRLVPEYGRLMVDARYRGRQLAELLGRRSLADARARGVPGVWAECVANHQASQRAVIAAGGIEMGLLLGSSPATVAMAGFSNTLDGRMSLVPLYIPLAVDPAPAAAYLPEHLTEVYRGLVERTGLQRDIQTSDEAATGEALVEVAVIPGKSAAVISVLAPGADGGARVVEQFRAVSGRNLAVVYLDLPLAHPSTPHAIRVAERYGFSWATLLPCARADGDVLRLQWLGAQNPDIHDIAYASDNGAAMGGFVIAERQRVLEAMVPGAPA